MTKRPIRVLMLLENNPYANDSRVRKEANTLTQAGYQVTVISPNPQGHWRRDIFDAVTVYSYPLPRSGKGVLGYVWEYGCSLLAMMLISIVVLAREGFDIIHAHNPPDMLVFVALPYKLFGKKFVFDHHDIAPELYRYARFGDEGNHAFWRILLWLERLSCQAANQVIATNESYKRIEMTRDSVPESRITIVRNGPDMARYPIAPDKMLVRPPEDKIIIGYLGMIGFQDGVDLLLQAISHLVRDLNPPPFHCRIMGAGDALPSMQALCTQLALDQYVTFTGWVQSSQVPQLLNEVDICAAPEPSNGYNDHCTMIKITEYTAAGKPIVAFDLPEHRWSAQDAALYAPPNDTLAYGKLLELLMGDPQKRAQMGEFGRRRAETVLAWSYQAQALLQAYQQFS